MTGLLPDHEIAIPVCFQQWRSVTFLHWRYSAEMIQQFLPQGLAVDTFDGSAWVSLTPFEMHALRLPGMPPFGSWSTFFEVNLRTYVRHADGSDGVWFFGLGCPRRALIAGARTLGLPYAYLDGTVFTAGLEAEGSPARVAYRSTGTARQGKVDIEIRPRGRIDRQSALEVFLTGRWNAFAGHGFINARIPVTHQPWKMQRAEVTEFSTDLLKKAWLPEPATPPLAYYADRVEARFGPPRLVRPKS